jgi:hypothetical protein
VSLQEQDLDSMFATSTKKKSKKTKSKKEEATGGTSRAFPPHPS